MVFGTTQRRQLLLPCLVLGMLLVILSQRRLMHRKLRHKAKLLEIQSARTNAEKGLVVTKQRDESIHWVWKLYPSWHPYIYSMSDTPEQGYLTMPTTRGRETTAFLTFIIDHYNTLPEYTAFVSAAQNPDLSTEQEQEQEQEQEHPMTSVLQTVDLSTVKAQGYANVHCTHQSHCARSLNVQSTTEPDAETDQERSTFRQIYATLFDTTEQDIPSHIEAPLSSQFIVSRTRIHDRPREDYERMREWAMQWDETESLEATEVFARLWHVVFGMPAVHCPDYEACRCGLFRECGKEDERLKRYYVPLVRGMNPGLGRWLGRWVGG